MTTIATDGWSMAGDGQSTDSGEAVASKQKKVRRLPDGSLVGGAGDTGLIQQAINALHNPTHGIGDVAGDFSLLRLTPTGKIIRYDGNLFAFEINAPAAIGSGGQFAVGAMLAGAEPHQAVEIAKKRDVYTGGRITSYYR